ncbi:non-ribosomal peptide synthetase [Micromonospora sp. WMMA1363]|uniref:non-ribosomal peptide synthetase n=1 Tax=Micromonospora sp. WMMA1363 TaxID=3053985 RepID=UPI00259D2AC5|nr:non-ribosomal peptide synthetase [Micromonospora sp. WMMA1363]MDM4719712.1 non-ribosomal peptide synthetase [Micromonospora sp. WMMA1363]
MKLADLNLLPDDEQQRLLHESKGPELSFPAEATIAQVFRERAAASPDVRAVVFDGSSLTYRELDEWSDRLAGELIAAHGTGPGQLVALGLNRGIEMTVAIIAVWKAGAAYVPIDPETPDERVRYMLDDTAAPVVLCGSAHQERMERIAAAGTAVRAVDGLWGRAVRAGGAAAPTETGADAGSLAYVIYTSGTTGKPKGVMIENRSVVNHVCVISDLYDFAGEPGQEVMLQVLNYAFDGGVVPMVLALLTGNSLLHVPDQLWLEAEKFTEYLRGNGVTHMNGTPTFYKHIRLGEVPSLKRMVIGGEALDAACFREMTRVNKVPVFNEYGPTEATISTTSHAAREYDLAIGRPQSNSLVLILDEARRIVPVGAVGEVFLGGPGLARGYLNMPELTAERFVPNPFQSGAEKADAAWGPDGRNARLYRTGDLARRRSDGALEYVGRNDSQIKVRGFRVEPAEIEATLNAYPGVTQSAVLPAQAGRHGEPTAEVTSLVGFYVAAEQVNVDELLRHMGAALPSYMVPTELVHVDVVPMTVNGKLDVKALHALRSGVDSDGVAPRTALEGRVQEIVAGIIGLEPATIGVEDDLFGLGLNSILVIQLISALNNELGVDIAVPSLFMYPTIAELTETPEFQTAQVKVRSTAD